jgi:hypothetical protein
MIFHSTPMERPRGPIPSSATDRAVSCRARLIARWQQDLSGRLSCRWRIVREPPGKPWG